MDRFEHIKTENKHIIRVVDSHLIEKGDPNSIVNLCWDIWKKHGYMNTVFFIDGSNRAMVNILKICWQESLWGI
jgi:spermidine/putrescine-binding protein